MVWKKIVLITTVVLLTVFELIACSCRPPYYSNFYDAITKHPYFLQSTNTIVLAQIVSFSDDFYFMNIEILDKLSGNINLSSATVSGQDGLNCAAALGNGFFHSNDTVILFLTPDFYGRTDTLELNDCSVSYLKYSNKKVLGNITSTQTEMDYSEFKALIKNYTSSFGLNALLEENQVSVFPNPGNGKFTIRFNSSNSHKFKILLTDICGRRIYSKEIDLTTKFCEVETDISDPEAGVFFLNIISDKIKITKKIVFR